MAVRKALGLPVILVKDSQSILSFSTVEFSIVEYDESLRIDTVQKEVAELSEALKSAGDSSVPKHELLVQLGLPLSGESASDSIHGEYESQHAEESKHVLPIISPLPEYVGDPLTEEELGELKDGDEFFHLNHGLGKVVVVKKSGNVKVAKVEFDSAARMIILGASNLLRKIEQ
jgi:hypothetical protein